MIRFERVTYTYPFQTCPAVSDISFSVRPGELVLCTKSDRSHVVL